MLNNLLLLGLVVVLSNELPKLSLQFAPAPCKLAALDALDILSSLLTLIIKACYVL